MIFQPVTLQHLERRWRTCRFRQCFHATTFGTVDCREARRAFRRVLSFHRAAMKRHASGNVSNEHTGFLFFTSSDSCTAKARFFLSVTIFQPITNATGQARDPKTDRWCRTIRTRANAGTNQSPFLFSSPSLKSQSPNSMTSFNQFSISWRTMSSRTGKKSKRPLCGTGFRNAIG